MGFGEKEGNFWLGLDELHKITNSTSTYKVKFEMMSWKDKESWLEYQVFKVADESKNFRLTIDAYDTASKAENVLMSANGNNFTTLDKDDDGWDYTNCASYVAGTSWLHFESNFV